MEHVLFKRVSEKIRNEFSYDGMTGFDMHFHTKYSMDGISRIPNVLKKAAKKGIGVAITDHNQIKGSIACQNNKKKIPIIPGIEVTCKEGTHILLYFYTPDELREFYTKNIMPDIKKNPFSTRFSAHELLQLSKDYNCVNSAAHPYAPGVLGVKHIPITNEMIRNINNIEVMNGYCTRNMNIKSMIWSDEIGKRPTGGSDGHITSELGRTLTFTPGNTVEEALQAVRKGNARIVGKEFMMLKKIIVTLDKGGTYLKRSIHQKKTLLFLKIQLGNEFRYIKESIENRKSKKMEKFRERHIRKKLGGNRRNNIKKIIKCKR